MNPFRKLAQDLAQFSMDIRAKVNPALKKLEPLEQQEVSEPVRELLRAVKWGIEDAERMAATFDDKIEKVTAMANIYEKELAEAAVAAAIAGKTVIPIDDHNNALTAARESASTEARTAAEGEFNAKLASMQLVAERRADAVKRVGEIAAATLTDEILAGDKHEEALAAVEARVAKLKEHEITPEARPKIYGDLIAKADEASFTSGLEIILEAAGGKLAAAAPAASGPKVSTTGAADLSATAPEKKKIVI